MRWDSDGRRRRKLEWLCERAHWHVVFAWWPVSTVEGCTVWLEFVWRRWLPRAERWSHSLANSTYAQTMNGIDGQ